MSDKWCQINLPNPYLVSNLLLNAEKKVEKEALQVLTNPTKLANPRNEKHMDFRKSFLMLIRCKNMNTIKK